MFIFLLIVLTLIAFFATPWWFFQIVEYEGAYFIRRWVNIIGWEYLEIPQKSRYSERYTAPYWWPGRSYTQVSKFNTIEEAEEGFRLSKNYRKPKDKAVKFIR